MTKIWNIGNTTLRNPNRIEQGLLVFKESGFEGNIEGTFQEARFTESLFEAKVLTTVQATDDEKKAWFGRKWRSSFVKLGFILDKKYKINGKNVPASSLLAHGIPNISGINYEITPIGHRLLEATSVAEKEEIFLRQFICHEVPNPIESSFPEGNMKPFIFFIQILVMLQKDGHKGLNKVETGLFVQPFTNHNEDAVTKKYKQILAYRNDIKKISGRERKKFEADFAKEISSKIGVMPGTLFDYSDTTFRYYSLTGLFQRNGERISIRENKSSLVNEILKEQPVFEYQTNPIAYLNKFYNGIAIPTDNLDFIFESIKELQIEKNEQSVKGIPNYKPADYNDVIKAKKIRYELIEKIGWSKEETYAINQSAKEEVTNILDYLEALANGGRSKTLEILDAPAYLEWAIWRSFLAIDTIACPIHETRGFNVDEDFLPLTTAPGGRPDMFFKFKDFNLVVEVTLTTNIRQLVAESEPVRRHVSDLIEGSSKPLYCLFIAPTIDNNIAEAFRLGTYYKGNDLRELKIIPVSIKEFYEIFQGFKTKAFTPDDLLVFLDACLSERHNPAPAWKSQISKNKIEFIGNLTI